jgi:phage-related protein (TIGR01555 family)
MKQSVKGAARQAKTQDERARKAVAKEMYESIGLNGVTSDSFVNFAHKLGVGADNPLSFASYGYNPLTRNRQQLEWIHRGSWLGGVAVDLIADDMTRAGAEITSEMEAHDTQRIEFAATTMGIWDKLNLTIKWGRLYGGCIAVMLIDGQDLKTPLRLETVQEEQFKGLCVLDRWMLEPSLGDLVTDYGPDMGLPKFYRVGANAPALRGSVIHHTRIALRHVGVDLPYQQQLTENLWGISVLERLYDRMLAYDSASTGAAQLVYRAFMRTFKIKDMRSVVAAGGAPLDGLTKYVDLMRRYQGIEGISMIDSEDEFEVQGTAGAFSGLSDALTQFAQQISGALQVPLVRLLGQSPGGLNSSGDSDLRTYYDGISQQQNRQMYVGVNTIYKLLAATVGVKVEDDFDVRFASLWQLSDKEKADVAKTTGETVQAAVDGGLIGHRTALLELRQQSRATGVFTNITSEQIEAADDEVLPPVAEKEMGLEHEKDLTETQLAHESTEADKARKASSTEADKGRQHQQQMAKLAAKRSRSPAAGNGSR